VVQGVKSLSSGHDKPHKPSGRKTAAKGEATQKDTGSALRTVYQKTVEEAIPDEMLDLLGKLK